MLVRECLDSVSYSCGGLDLVVSLMSTVVKRITCKIRNLVVSDRGIAVIVMYDDLVTPFTK